MQLLVIRRQQEALATEESYAHWLRRDIGALKNMPSTLTSKPKLDRFLTEPALKYWALCFQAHKPGSSCPMRLHLGSGIHCVSSILPTGRRAIPAVAFNSWLPRAGPPCWSLAAPACSGQLRSLLLRSVLTDLGPGQGGNQGRRTRCRASRRYDMPFGFPPRC